MPISLDELQRLIAQGETATVELKAEPSEEVLRGLSTDLAALANSQGGIIIFGVTDKKDPAGCELTGHERDRISQEASNCKPAIHGVDFEDIPFGARRFLVVKIPETTMLHSDTQKRFPVRVGNITDYYDGLTLAVLLQERSTPSAEGRWAVMPQLVAAPSSAFERQREPLPRERARLLADLLTDGHEEVRIEACRDLAGQAFMHEVFADKEIQEAVKRLLATGSEEERRPILQTVRFLQSGGTDREKAAAEKLLNAIVDVVRSTASSNLANMGIQPLVSAKHPEAVDLLVHFLQTSEDPFYTAVQPQNFAQDLRSSGLDAELRKRLYDLLRSGPDDRIRKRISESLAALRF